MNQPANLDNRQRAHRIEQLSSASRLNDLSVFMKDGQDERRQKISTVLEKLDPGVYLIGTGPYTQGVFSLMCDEVIIGRLATPLEKPLDLPVDILINDAATLTPREVSRVHCSIYRRAGVEKHDYWILDKASTCGTFLNGEPLNRPPSLSEDDIRRVSQALSDGDIISLGCSLINTFLFIDTRI